MMVARCVAVLLLALGATAAGAQSRNLAPGFEGLPAGAKAVLMPVDGELFSLSAGGVPEPRADWTADAQRHMNTALKDPTIVKGIVDRGDEPGGGTPEQLGTLTRNQFKTWGDVVKANNIRAD